MPRKQTNFAASSAAVSKGLARARARRQCDEWNAAHPVGTAVVLTKDGGEVVNTKTRSEAYICDAGYAVLFLEGVTGYYLLDRVRPAVSETTHHE